MVPIRFKSQNEIRDLQPHLLQEKIIEMCKEHHRDGRALAFAFILFDQQNPHIAKVLCDFDYWNSLDALSGNYLSVFHFHVKHRTLNEDMKKHDGMVTKGLHEVGATSSILAKIRYFINPTDDVHLPCILFFQTNGNMILDHFFVQLHEEQIEKSYLELKAFIESAVQSLIKVTEQNKGNRQPIFDLIERSIKSTEFTRNLKRSSESFPLNLLLGWIVGKL